MVNILLLNLDCAVKIFVKKVLCLTLRSLELLEYFIKQNL
ncbi:protein of unknown function [Tepidibacter aestuarii]|nr:protein of unknown function [Tepidibacter aestuarii]